MCFDKLIKSKNAVTIKDRIHTITQSIKYMNLIYFGYEQSFIKRYNMMHIKHF